MAKLTKRFKALQATVVAGKSYPLEEALKLLQANANAKFVESIDVAVRLGVDAKKSDQVVRGAVVLPNGTGKTARVAVFAQGAKADEAKAAGADVVGMDDLAARVKAGDAALIDARPAEFFNGDTRHVAAGVPGTLQGAVNVEHDKWFAPGTSTFLNTEQAQKVAAASPIDPAKETVSFCNTGHWAATNWFAMSEVLGQKNVKLYPGSMVEWSKDPNGLPMANVPSRPKQLMIDAKFWAEKTFK